MKLRCFIVMVAIVLTACAHKPSVPPGFVSQEYLLSASDKSIQIVKRPASAFLLKSGVTSATENLPNFFGAIGAVVALSAARADVKRGNAMVSKYQIEDPAVSIAKQVTTRLERKYKIRNDGLGSPEIKVGRGDVEDIAGAYRASSLALDVVGLVWVLDNVEEDKTRLGITYWPRLRIIETSSQKVIAEITCGFNPSDSSIGFTKSKFIENEEIALKAEVAHLVSYCVDVFSKRLGME
jgi:hypothetical protein